MGNLVFKDLYLQRNSSIFGFVISILFVFLQMLIADIFNNSFMFLYWYFLMFMTYLSVLYADGYDDKNKAQYMLCSLPIKKNDLVKSKYLSLIVYGIIYTSYLVIVPVVFKLIGINKNANIISIETLVASFVVIALIYSIYYPIYFKFGASAIKIFKVIMWFVIFLSPKGFDMLIDKLGKNNFSTLIMFIKSNFNLFLSGLVIVAIVMLALSLILSIKLYERTDI